MLLSFNNQKLSGTQTKSEFYEREKFQREPGNHPNADCDNVKVLKQVVNVRLFSKWYCFNCLTINKMVASHPAKT